MAIAKMKKMTLLAEQSNKDPLLKAVQEMQSLEIIPLSDSNEDELYEQFSFEDTNNQTSKFDSKLKDIQHAIDYLNDYIEGPGLVEKLKTQRERMSLADLEERIESKNIDQLLETVLEKEKEMIRLSDKRKVLREDEAFLRKWSTLEFNPNTIGEIHLMTVQLGTIHSEDAYEFKQELKNVGSAYYEEIYSRKDDSAYLIIGDKEQQKEIEQVLQNFQFNPIEYLFNDLPQVELEKNLKVQDDIIHQKQFLTSEIAGFKEAMKELELAEEYYYNYSQRESAKQLLMNSESLFLLYGWLEEERIPQLIDSIDKVVGKENVAVLDEDVELNEYKKVPIVLKNNAVVTPFETVTEMYSLPKYDEIDPTPLMMPFYMIFFGMMSADLGYGLLLFAATLFALKGVNIEGSMRKNLKFFHVLSYSVMAFGVLFGSFFGRELPFVILSVQEDVIPILIISVALGFVQMFTGLITMGIVKGKQGQKAAAYIDGYSWAMILLGVLLWVLGSMVLDNSLLSTIGIIVAVLNVVGILFVSTLASKKKGLGFALGAYNIYGITGYVGDIVSYTRLMALAVSSASIALAFNMIVGFLPTAAKFSVGIVLIVALHSLNIFLTFLSAYVHTARLQYVEFFGKFYEGGGKKLNPLRTLEKYIFIDNKN
ncbi:V-type ATP synthase subunit I [Lacticigenium naphthae]|uniref:V-type ATP synthase subunit I n=1 Tax=Lacticigenium naphthae TaxID=515351 RepID=UPI00048A2226|nr:V-type ATP synthase subunit I [Lacticigenium naphthae]